MTYNNKTNMMIIHCCLNTGLQIQGEFAFVCEPCVGTINKTESSLCGLFEGKVGQLFKIFVTPVEYLLTTWQQTINQILWQIKEENTVRAVTAEGLY